MLDFPQADITIGYRGGPVVLEHPLTGLPPATLPAVEEVYSYRPESSYRHLWREAETVVGMVAFLADGFSLIDPSMTADSISLAAHGWLGHTEAASAAAFSLALPALAGVLARPGARAVADWASGVPDLAAAAVRPTGPLARQFDALGVPAARGFVHYDVVVQSGPRLRAQEVSGLRAAGFVSSGMLGDVRPATVVRQIGRGERVADLTDELKALTFRSRTQELPLGLKHAIVSKIDGTRWLVSGGQGGIDLNGFDGFRRLIVHTHGMPTGPSINADFPFLKGNKQMHSYIIELGNPNVIRFNKDGTYSEYKLR